MIAPSRSRKTAWFIRLREILEKAPADQNIIRRLCAKEKGRPKPSFLVQAKTARLVRLLQSEIFLRSRNRVGVRACGAWHIRVRASHGGCCLKIKRGIRPGENSIISNPRNVEGWRTAAVHAHQIETD